MPTQARFGREETQRAKALDRSLFVFGLDTPDVRINSFGYLEHDTASKLANFVMYLNNEESDPDQAFQKAFHPSSPGDSITKTESDNNS